MSVGFAAGRRNRWFAKYRQSDCVVVVKFAKVYDELLDN
jgi:hypothetical protein